MDHVDRLISYAKAEKERLDEEKKAGDDSSKKPKVSAEEWRTRTV